MFNWTISLSDKQVIMLTAFYMAKPDKEGSIFPAAHSMIADAWDIRAVRKLEEQNLISIVKGTGVDGRTTTVWKLLPKGKLIAQAILCDAENLKALRDRQGKRIRNTEKAVFTTLGNDQ